MIVPPADGPEVGLIDVSVGTTATGGVCETSADGALSIVRRVVGLDAEVVGHAGLQPRELPLVTLPTSTVVDGLPDTVPYSTR